MLCKFGNNISALGTGLGFGSGCLRTGNMLLEFRGLLADSTDRPVIHSVHFPCAVVNVCFGIHISTGLTAVTTAVMFLIAIVLAPVFTAIPLAIVWVFYICIFVFSIIVSANPDFMDTPDEAMPLIIVLLVAYAAMAICALLSNTIRIICDYKVYEEIVPKRAFLYTILGLLVPFAQGICLLTCKKYGTGETFDTNDMSFGGTAQVNEPAPAVEDVTPVVEEVAPVVEDVAPVAEDIAPVAEDSCGETEILTTPDSNSDTEIFTE